MVLNKQNMDDIKKLHEFLTFIGDDMARLNAHKHTLDDMLVRCRALTTKTRRQHLIGLDTKQKFALYYESNKDKLRERARKRYHTRKAEQQQQQQHQATDTTIL